MMNAKRMMAGMVLGAAFLTGCSTPEPEKPREFVNLPVYVAARGIPADSQEKYMSNPDLRAYAVGRYVDPVTGTVMHEEHSVYRLVKGPAWNLIPQPDAEPLRHAEKSTQERFTDAATGQMFRAAAEIDHARSDVEKLNERQDSLSLRNEALNTELQDIRAKYAVLVNNLQRLSEYVNQLEAKLKPSKPVPPLETP